MPSQIFDATPIDHLVYHFLPIGCAYRYFHAKSLMPGTSWYPLVARTPCWWSSRERATLRCAPPRYVRAVHVSCASKGSRSRLTGPTTWAAQLGLQVDPPTVVNGWMVSWCWWWLMVIHDYGHCRIFMMTIKTWMALIISDINHDWINSENNNNDQIHLVNTGHPN